MSRSLPVPRIFLPKQPTLPRLSNSFSEIGFFFRVLVIDVDKRCFRSNGKGGNEAAFDQLMRDEFQQVPIFKGSGFMLSCITDKIPLFDPVMQHLVPLGAGRKSGAPSAAKTGALDFSHDVIWGEFFQTLLARHHTLRNGDMGQSPMVPLRASAELLVRLSGHDVSLRDGLKCDDRYYKAAPADRQANYYEIRPESQALRTMDLGGWWSKGNFYVEADQISVA